MDYTKDAIVVHEGLKSSPLELEEVVGRRARSENSETVETFSHSLITVTKMNESGSEFVEKKALGEPNLSTILLSTTMNASSSLFSGSSSHAPPLEDDQFDATMMNDTMEYIPYSMRPETYIVPVLFAIIFVIGVIGNGTLIAIFIKERCMRNVPNMFIVSLAIGDMLVILFCVPFTSTVYTVDSWPYGVVVCKFSEFIKDLSVGVSVFTLTALSADRYFAIVDPMRKLTGRRATRVTIISIIGIWTLSILVALPSALYSYIRVFPDYEEGEEEEMEGSEMDGRTFQVCYPYPTEFGPTYAQVMVMFHFLVYYAVPLLFIATFYIIMARHLVLSTRNMPGEAQGQVKQIQARKKVAKMILSFVVIFAICFFPHHLFLLWFYFYPDSENSFNAFWNICRILGFCLTFMNSCINPITLYCVSGTFRKQFNEHLFCCFCRDHGSRPSRGGRFSAGGTQVGGGGGRGGICAACVSLSGNHGQMYGNDSRYGNGSLGRGGNGRMYRGSTWDSSDRMMSKRRSTWETQTTVVNHRVMNLAGGANIQVNLCSEHEHIPMKNFANLSNTKSHQMMTSGGGTNNSAHPATSAAAVFSSMQQQGNGIRAEGRKPNPNGPHFDQNGVGCSRRCSVDKGSSSSSSSKANNKRRSNFNKQNSDNRRKSFGGGESEIIQPVTKLSPGVHKYPSLIEEETSVSENDNSSSSKSSRQHSPSKSYAKVGEIFSKISNKYTSNNCSSNNMRTSPIKQRPVSSNSNSTSTPSWKVSPGNKGKASSRLNNAASDVTCALLPATKNKSNEMEMGMDEHEFVVSEMNYNNNILMKESPEESTVTCFITVPVENEPLGNNKVIICYN